VLLFVVAFLEFAGGKFMAQTVAPAALPVSRSRVESARAAGAPPRTATAEIAPPDSRGIKRGATDDEILGINTAPRKSSTDVDQLGLDFEEGQKASGDYAPGADADKKDVAADGASGEPDHLRDAFDANPELRAAWHEAQAYRETFPTPEEARGATVLLADLNRMDALFFSGRAEDHAELARAVADLDPAAFASLAQAMNGLATETQKHRANAARNTAAESSAGVSRAEPRGVSSALSPSSENRQQDAGATGIAVPSQAQSEFFHATNVSAVEGVLEAIESQVERLLPEGVSKSARNRVVGEIYRELDATLRSNRDLAGQMRDVFRSGSLDADHQRAVVSLITGRARQALPGVAKRVLNEWTSTLVAANQERRARQRTAERRVDIAGAGGAANDGRRAVAPREIDYGRMSDADILNL
jgi:hypothetical protein